MYRILPIFRRCREMKYRDARKLPGMPRTAQQIRAMPSKLSQSGEEEREEGTMITWFGIVPSGEEEVIIVLGREGGLVLLN